MTDLAHATTRTADHLWRARAARVVPGGVYGHMSTATLPAAYPQFYAAGEGTRVTDVDGAEYIDMMCSWGPMIVGYRNPAVEAAASAQARLGDLLPGISPQLVELAEELVEQVAHADWAMFAKNGTDVTTMAVTLSRAATGRSKVLKAASAYHGAAPWCTPFLPGITREDRTNVVEFQFGDLDSVATALQAHPGDTAAIIASPVRQDAFTDQLPTSATYARGLRELADRHGAVLILDEVRTGLRLDPRGAWEGFGVRPDLTAWSKGIANGHALAALTGIDALREPAQEIYVTGSFWYTSAAMAASRATLAELRRLDGVARMARLGTRLCDGLRTQARAAGFDVVVSGPPSMPFLRFSDDEDLARANAWCAAALEGGALLHPWHNWFVSAAHTDDDIDRVLAATDSAFRLLASRS